MDNSVLGLNFVGYKWPEDGLFQISLSIPKIFLAKYRNCSSFSSVCERCLNYHSATPSEAAPDFFFLGGFWWGVLQGKMQLWYKVSDFFCYDGVGEGVRLVLVKVIHSALVKNKWWPKLNIKLALLKFWFGSRRRKLSVTSTNCLWLFWQSLIVPWLQILSVYFQFTRDWVISKHSRPWVFQSFNRTLRHTAFNTTFKPCQPASIVRYQACLTPWGHGPRHEKNNRRNWLTMNSLASSNKLYICLKGIKLVRHKKNFIILYRNIWM